MFTRITSNGGRSYLQIMESYRNDEGKPRVRVVARATAQARASSRHARADPSPLREDRRPQAWRHNYPDTWAIGAVWYAEPPQTRL